MDYLLGILTGAAVASLIWYRRVKQSFAKKFDPDALKAIYNLANIGKVFRLKKVDKQNKIITLRVLSDEQKEAAEQAVKELMNEDFGGRAK